MLVDRSCTVLGNVFRAFLRSSERGQAAGDYSLHHLGIGAERRRTFARVENAETARRSRADVKKPTTFSERVFGNAQCSCDLVALREDRIGNHAVFGVYEI